MDWELIGALVPAGAAVLAGAGYVARGVWRGARAVGDFLADWRGEPARPGVPARLGVPERLASIEGGVRDLYSRVAPGEEPPVWEGR